MKNPRKAADNLAMAKTRLGMTFEDLRGRIGDEVLVRTLGGLALRSRPTYKYPVKPATQASADRFKAANDVWLTMSYEQVQTWNRYGAGITKSAPISGKQYEQTGRSAFIGLSTKFLQANPMGAVPVVPPSSKFLADSLTLKVAAASGGVRFTASAPNSPGVVTELLVQKLASPRRSPGKFYKSAAFVAFATGSLSFDLPLEPGSYAFAYQFVRSATGQVAGYGLLGVLEV